MGNKLSCSCAPLIRKAYRYEDSPWQTSRRRDGHLLRFLVPNHPLPHHGGLAMAVLSISSPSQRTPSSRAGMNNDVLLQKALEQNIL
uniref:Uncharacterized protein n=1 Tax=Timema shepardi TaxID=629360 RepID=A0A7R9AMB6_TIMSH|nr:unnamed protein product [Timema shepardi]